MGIQDIIQWSCTVVLYPNSTHILQVLDVAVFGPLKSKYTQNFQKLKADHTKGTYNEIEFIKVLKQTNDEVINKDTIINGWRSTGLQPFNFGNIKFDRSRLRELPYRKNFRKASIPEPFRKQSQQQLTTSQWWSFVVWYDTIDGVWRRFTKPSSCERQ